MTEIHVYYQPQQTEKLQKQKTGNVTTPISVILSRLHEFNAGIYSAWSSFILIQQTI
jgi:hypothetical protein